MYANSTLALYVCVPYSLQGTDDRDRLNARQRIKRKPDEDGGIATIPLEFRGGGTYESSRTRGTDPVRLAALHRGASADGAQSSLSTGLVIDVYKDVSTRIVRDLSLCSFPQLTRPAGRARALRAVDRRGRRQGRVPARLTAHRFPESKC